MNVNDIVVGIIAVFFCLGALDRLLGNKWGLGERFSEGFAAMGSLTLVMVGIVSLAPVLAKLLIPLISPLYEWIGADPSSFANTILAADMGGYSLAQEMANSPEAALFSWVLLGTMMGPTIVFTIPVALGIIGTDDRPYFAKGILLGVITIPVGCFVGGLVAGLSPQLMLINLAIPVLFSIVISIGLWKFTDTVIRIFFIFGKFIEILAIAGLTAISVETLTGLVLIPGLAPLEEGIQTVGKIAIVLAGAFPMVTFLSTRLNKYLTRAGALMKIDQIAAAGLLATLAHNIPMLALLKDMDPRGKIINVTFAVSGAFVFGGHLGYVAGMDKSMVFAMIVGKLTGGSAAVLLALLVTRKMKK